jgi:hypothetical protein
MCSYKPSAKTKTRIANKAVRSRNRHKHGWRSGSQRVMDSAVGQKQRKHNIAMKAVRNR